MGGAAAGAMTLGLIIKNSTIYRADESLQTNLVLEPQTKTFFPTEWKVSSSNTLQKLVGTGVRAVTVLQFHAYSMAFYIGPDTIKRLQSSSRWNQEFCSVKWTEKNAESREYFLKSLVQEPSEMTILITPVRPTDGVHLRNGFIKLLQTRFQKEIAQKTVTDAERKEISESLEKFKTLFPSRTVDKGTRLSFELQSDGLLCCSIAGKVMGVVENKKVASWFFEGYLLGDEISPSFVRGVGLGLETLIVETNAGARSRVG